MKGSSIALALGILLPGLLAGCTGDPEGETPAALEPASFEGDTAAEGDGPATATPRPSSPPATTEPAPASPSPGPATDEAAEDEAPPAFEPRAVLALVDDGINPYHEAFRDPSPRAQLHPSTYLPGYPADAIALRLTFGKATLEESLKADCAEWAKVGPDRLHWFPGTRIVGARTLAGGAPVTCDEPEPAATGNLVGSGGHGTMTASRAAGKDYGACPACLVVMLQGFDVAHVTWASLQSWIDVQSDSWGPFLPAPMPAAALGAATPSPAFARAVEEAAARQPSFWASGNGALTRFGAAGHPTQLQPHMTPSAISVGGHDSGKVAPWPGWGPHVVSDACDSWAAEHASTTESTPRTGSGTSAATPYAAGLAARLVLESRRILAQPGTGIHGGLLVEGPGGLVAKGPLADGDLTVAELREVLFRTADPRPHATADDGETCDDPLTAPYWTAPAPWASAPEGPVATPFLGYGAVTKETFAAALDVLRGNAPLPERPDEEAWFQRDAELRQRTYEAYVGLA